MQAQIQGDQLRVSGKKSDDLQAVQQLLRGADLDVAAAVRPTTADPHPRLAPASLVPKRPDFGPKSGVSVPASAVDDSGARPQVGANAAARVERCASVAAPCPNTLGAARPAQWLWLRRRERSYDRNRRLDALACCSQGFVLTHDQARSSACTRRRRSGGWFAAASGPSPRRGVRQRPRPTRPRRTGHGLRSGDPRSRPPRRARPSGHRRQPRKRGDRCAGFRLLARRAPADADDARRHRRSGRRDADAHAAATRAIRRSDSWFGVDDDASPLAPSSISRAATACAPASSPRTPRSTRARRREAALRRAVHRARGWPGVRSRASCVVELADARAESPLESLTRLLVIDHGLPPSRAADRGSTRIDGMVPGRRHVAGSECRPRGRRAAQVPRRTGRAAATRSCVRRRSNAPATASSASLWRRSADTRNARPSASESLCAWAAPAPSGTESPELGADSGVSIPEAGLGRASQRRR